MGIPSDSSRIRGASAFVEAVGAEPDDEDVRFLTSVATGGDGDRARWELRYARRALGLLAAQRDALNDRTGSAVAHEMARALANDRHVAAGMVKVAERQFNDRLSSYRDVLSSRVSYEGTGVRLARTLLTLAGAAAPDEFALTRAGDLLARYLGEANEALRKSFGVATLPDSPSPSSLDRDSR